MYYIQTHEISLKSNLHPCEGRHRGRGSPTAADGWGRLAAVGGRQWVEGVASC